jgi:predicted TPR repeat methyltransferase
LADPAQPDPGLAQSRHQASLRAFAAGDLAAAARQCDEVLAADPARVDALVLRAAIHQRQRDYPAAEACARKAIAADPGRAAAHCALAQACRAQERPDEAIGHFRNALAVDGGNVESLAGMGAALGALARTREAVEFHRKVAALRPGLPAAHYNLGRACEDAGDLPEAVRCYRHSLALDPGQSHAWLNLGGAAALLGDVDAALEAFSRAIAIRPGYAAAHNNLGTIHQRERRYDAAAECFRKAVDLDPGYAEAWRNLGVALSQLGLIAEAEQALGRALQIDPGYESARFSLGLLHGANPPRAPVDTIRTLFDDYAARFDAHLVDRLGYRVPERLASRIGFLRPAEGSLDVLDLGCGTGLFGAAIRRWAGRLTGVDLSTRMLDRARERDYDRLICEDVEAFLQREPARSCDLVAATDVFNYLGSLEDTFAQTSRVLRTGGLFAFSIEALGAKVPEGYRLQTTGRYAHDDGYVRALGERHGFTVLSWVAEALRNEGNSPVAGWVVILQKA